MHFWNQQQMDRCNRVNVVEYQDVFVFVRLFAWEFPAHNLAEEAVIHRSILCARRFFRNTRHALAPRQLAQHIVRMQTLLRQQYQGMKP